MKRTLIIVISLLLFAAVSCKKTELIYGGSWTFKGITYQAATVSGLNLIDEYHAWTPLNDSIFFAYGSMLASTSSAAPYGILSFTFDTAFSDSFPKPGNYTVTTALPPGMGNVYILFTDTALSQSWRASGSTAPQVTVTMTNGKYSISCPPVMLVNANGGYPPSGPPSGTDSGLLTATNIHQNE